MKDDIKPDQRMWRTLVRVTEKFPDGVVLIIPGVSVKVHVFCPREAIPPYIFDNMVEGGRYHVGCNIGSQNIENKYCFDCWEDS